MSTPVQITVIKKHQFSRACLLVYLAPSGGISTVDWYCVSIGEFNITTEENVNTK